MTLQELLAKLQDLETHAEGVLYRDKPVIVRSVSSPSKCLSLLTNARFDSDLGRFVLEVEPA